MTTPPGQRLLNHLMVAHPSPPTAAAYFYPEPGSGLFTYAADWLPALSPSGAANFQSGDLPLPQEWGRSRAGAGGAAALLSPAHQVLPQPPPAWFELNEATIEDSEPFELDGLQHYQLKALLLDAHLTEGTVTERRDRLQLTGLLPTGVVWQPAAG